MTALPEIEILEWNTIDLNTVRATVHAARTQPSLKGQPVKLRAPNLDRLLSAIASQAQEFSDPSQASAVTAARERVASSEIWCGRLLEGLSSFPDADVATACSVYLRWRMTETIHSLASYQRSSEEVLCDEFSRWMRYATAPALAQYTFRSRDVIQLYLVAGRHDEARKRSISVYLPPESMAHHLQQFELHIGKKYLPATVWINFLAPQVAAANADGHAPFCPWTPDATLVITEGVTWHGESAIFP
jgi:hypothetical protein